MLGLSEMLALNLLHRADVKIPMQWVVEGGGASLLGDRSLWKPGTFSEIQWTLCWLTSLARCRKGRWGRGETTKHIFLLPVLWGPANSRYHSPKYLDHLDPALWGWLHLCGPAFLPINLTDPAYMGTRHIQPGRCRKVTVSQPKDNLAKYFDMGTASFLRQRKLDICIQLVHALLYKVGLEKVNDFVACPRIRGSKLYLF